MWSKYYFFYLRPHFTTSSLFLHTSKFRFLGASCKNWCQQQNMDSFNVISEIFASHESSPDPPVNQKEWLCQSKSLIFWSVEFITRLGKPLNKMKPSLGSAKLKKDHGSFMIGKCVEVALYFIIWHVQSTTKALRATGAKSLFGTFRTTLAAIGSSAMSKTHPTRNGQLGAKVDNASIELTN